MYDNNFKKCPFNNKNTGVGARVYTECNDTSCRFQTNSRCIILENHETLARLEKKLDLLLRSNPAYLINQA